MFGKTYFIIRFVTVLAFSLAVAVEVSGQTQKKLEADTVGFQPQIVRGQSGDVKVYGKNLLLQSAEVNPSDGVKVTGIKESSPDPRYPATQEKDVRNWTINVSTSPNAQPGERSLILRSSEGHMKSESIRIVSHKPKISDLRVLATEATNVKVNIELAVFDEAGDITPAKKPSYTLWLKCGGSGIFSSSTVAEVTLKNKKSSTVQ